MHNDINMMIYS